MVILILPKECISLLPTRLGKLGCIPGNRSPIMTQMCTMVDGVMSGEEHIVGQLENVLRHSRRGGDGGKVSREVAT